MIVEKNYLTFEYKFSLNMPYNKLYHHVIYAKMLYGI